MKKRILIIGMVLALILTLAAPAAAFAKPNKHYTWSDFTANATLGVVGPGESSIKFRGNGQISMTTTNEIIAGVFDNYSNWEDARGASLLVVHDSKVTLYPYFPYFGGKGYFEGKSNEDVTITFTNGTVLTGTSKTTITGWYHFEANGNIFCDYIYDFGDFKLCGGDTSASGSWNASFTPGVFDIPPYGEITTLGGPAVFSGTYFTWNK